MRRKRTAVVEFTSREEMLDFVDEVTRAGGINSYAITSAKPRRAEGADNTVTGPVTGNVVQCDNIDGGVHL